MNFQITELLHPHYVKERGYIYDHINWTIWFSRSDLINDVNKQFNTQFKLEEKTTINSNLAYNIWNYLRDRNDVVGTFGTEYDKNILYVDYDDADRSW